MKLERRKIPRYPVLEEEIIAMAGDPQRVATVNNVGAGGFQLRYFPGKEEKAGWTRVDVFSSDRNTVLLRGVCCRITYDIPDLIECYTYSGKNVRLCGLSFGELTLDQRAALERLLNRCSGCEGGAGNRGLK